MVRPRLGRRLGQAAAGVAVGLVVVLAAEIQVARTRPKLPPAPPLRLDGAVAGHLPDPPVRLVWVGDSTAAGVGASTAEASVPHQVAVALGRRVHLTVLAGSGARVADVLADQLPGVAALHPDVVFVSVGANDTVHLTPAGDFGQTYRRLLDGLAGVDRVVLLGVPDMGSPPRFLQPLRAIVGWRGRALDSRVRAAAGDRHGVHYVDIAGRTGPAMRQDPDRYFSADGYHPGDAGYRLWADAVADVVRPLIS